MSDILIEYTCPLGHDCETVDVDNRGKITKIKRCRWYVQLAGQNPQTGEQVDEWNCAMGWMPIMLVENAMTNGGQTSAIESFRNEMVRGQDTFNQIVLQTSPLISQIGQR
jgi:hypothetical protein